MMYFSNTLGDTHCHQTDDKIEMIEQLKQHGDAVIVLDYTLFDINDVEELEILYQRFPQAQWVLFSDDLSTDFVRRVVAISPRFSILMKESPSQEILACLQYARRHQQTEVLKDIALGLTTKEIAEKRFSSFHTVNTHRKNIFRKLGVNTVHEATKYALRAGLVDSAEYYI